MGGDDLGSDDECLYASNQSAENDLSDTEEQTDGTVGDTTNKRKCVKGLVEPTISTKKPKTEKGSVTVSEQTAQDQAAILSSALAKYASTLDSQPRNIELEAGYFATSTQQSLLLRLTSVVAQNKIRKWKHKLSPCVVVVCLSARRAVHVLKELSPMKARAAKLFPKNNSITEQLKELAETTFGLAVGTPHRLQALCKGDDSACLSFRHTKLVVFDCELSDKHYSVLTLPDTAPSCLGLLVEHILPELHKRKDIRIGLL
ncbi:hypothetical protein MPSEU_000481200 [Mayamaea pseudoterrestris]|nr:hypothetical protein MPSEU_000481200 [Mayamaea pseudoterrestris]